jgi:hypothetical protein
VVVVLVVRQLKLLAGLQTQAVVAVVLTKETLVQVVLVLLLFVTLPYTQLQAVQV